MDSLYDDADLYDLVAPPDAAMAGFYEEAAGGPGRRVLELACGTGRITVPLARTGAIVTGGDLSEAMLRRARARAAEQGVSADFLQLDMRDFVLGRQFDAVVIAANSLLHLHTRADFARTFGTIRQHLTSGGRLYFDVFVPSTHMLSRPADERQLVNTFAHPQLGEVSITETTNYDPIKQVSHIDWFWSTPGRDDFRHTLLEMRQIFPQELPLLLASGGLRLEARYGGFDRSALNGQSRRQVCIAVAA